MSAALEYARYQFAGNDELCLKAGSHHPKAILLIPPLFDEMNRMRRMLLDVMRLLDAKGIGSILPDLPGTNESLFPQEQASLTIWRQALLACTSALSPPLYVASCRGGCLIDDFNENARLWRFSAVKGQMLLRTMMRTRIAADKEAGHSTAMPDLIAEAEQGQVNLAGNNIGSELFSQLEEAVPLPMDDVRATQLESSTRAADIKLPGSALWLRAEPDEDLLLSAAIADDLGSWVAE